MKRSLILVSAMVLAVAGCGGPRGTIYSYSPAASPQSQYTPQTRSFVVTTVPILGHEMEGTLDFLKQDFGPHGLLHGKEVYGFVPSTLVVYQGDTVNVTVVNPEDDPHTFTISALGVNLDVKALASARTSFVASKVGVFDFVCEVPEHAPYMWGQLVVLPGSAGPSMSEAMGTAAAAPTHGTVNVAMDEFSFSPSSFTVKTGSTVQFAFTNRGKVEHEAVIGDMAFQRGHEKEMSGGAQTGGMSDELEVEVAPGQTKTLTYTFSKAGTFYIGCHLPGHWDAGMRAQITVRG